MRLSQARCRASYGALAALMLMAAANAQAQDGDDDEVSADESENVIIVTARQRDEVLLEVPLAVSVTTAEQLSRDQVYSLADLQRITPALQVSPTFGGDINGGAGIRGIRTQAFNPSVQPSVAIVIDQAAAGNVSFPILHDIAQVEVLRGPQGTLFGQGASAGVVSISTVAPELGQTAANFNLDYADDGFAGSEQTEIVARGGMTFSLGEKVAVRIAGFYRQDVGLRTNTFLNDLDDEQDQYAIRGRLLFEPVDTLRIHLIGDYAVTDEDGVNFFSPTLAPTLQASQDNLSACGLTPDRITARAQFFCEDVQSQESRSIVSLTALVEADLTDSLTLTSVTSYRDLTVETPNRNFSVRAVGTAARSENVRGDYEQFIQEVRLGYQGRGFDIVAGGYFADFSYASSPLDQSLPFGDGRRGFRTGFSICNPEGTFCPVPPAFVREEASNQTIAVFADATAQLTDRLELFGGLRFTDYKNDSGFGVNTLVATDLDSISETNLSGRVGLSYELNPDTFFYGSFSRGYKPSALAFPADPGAPFIPLAAEENTAFELGAKTMIGRVQLDFNAFYMNVANFQGQESIFVGSDLISQPRNIGDVESYGFEILASGQVTDKLSLSAGYTFNPVLYPENFIGDDGTNLGREQLLGVPEHKFVLSGEYVEPVSNDLEAFFNTNIVYRSELRTSNREADRFVIPAGELVNLRLGIRQADGNWTASIFVRNLTKIREVIGAFPLNFRGADDGSVRSAPVSGLTTRVVGASLGFNF